MKLRNIKISKRIYTIVGVFILFIMLIMIIFRGFVSSLQGLAEKSLGEVMLEDQKQKVFVATHTLAKALSKQVKDIESDSLKLDIIRKDIWETRYEKDKSGYFFVYEGTVNRVFPVSPEKENKDLKGAVDTNGVQVIVELNKVAHAGGGFVEYLWPKPNAGIQPKVSYAMMIDGTNYWIGTGVYIDNIQAEQTRVVQEIREKSNGLFIFLTAAISVVLVILIIPSMLLIIKSITAPIKEVVEVSDALATGNVDVKLTITGRDEFSHMEESFVKLISSIQKKAEIAETIASNDLSTNVELTSADDRLGISLQKMQNSLRQLIRQIQESSNQIDTGSENLASLSGNLSNSATQQASSIEEISSTMHEINSGIQLAADRAHEADSLAQKQKENSKAGVLSMQELEHAISEINESNSEIAKIINVIEDITFQTNLLALNAAVEAARAGQHGKGFAVVAEEVRNLASRSSKAASEVTDLITRASERVERGTTVSATTASMLNTIGEGTDKVATILEEIRTTAQNQAISIGQINEGITVIGDATQGNAASSEESAAAAHELSHQSLTLRNMVDKFKI